MKLGKAKHTVKTINKEIKTLKKLLSNAPEQAIGEFLDYYDSLFEQKRNLETKIIETSQNILFDSSTTVLAAEKMLVGLREKIDLLSELYETNKSLTKEHKASILNKLIKYGASERTLLEALESCYWDTDLIE